MTKVRRKRLARQDLLDIGRYLAQESQSREVALRFLDGVAVKCELYANNPALREACEEFGPQVRRFMVGSYVVFYRPATDGIEVLRILHGGRDLPTAWSRVDPQSR